jgi:hypothetical protein
MNKKIFLFCVTIVLFLQAFSNDKSPARTSVEIYAVGQINQYPVYQFVFDNQHRDEFQIVLKDQYGTVLHDEFVSGKNIVRNYLLDLSDLGHTKVYAEIYDRFGTYIQRFQMEYK